MSDRPKPPAAGKGRPKGALNKSTLEAKAFAERMMDADYVAGLKRRLRAGKAPHMETLIAQYRWGKPKDTVALENSDGSPLSLIQRVVIDVNREEP